MVVRVDGFWVDNLGCTADRPSAKPRQTAINELHSLAQPATNYYLGPQDDFKKMSKIHSDCER